MVLDRTGRYLRPVAAVLAFTAHRDDQPGPFFLTTAKVPLTIDKGREGLETEILSTLRVTSLWRIGAMQAGATRR